MKKNPIQLANDVKSGKYKTTKESILPFFIETTDENGDPLYLIDEKTRIQSREAELDFEFCATAVAKMKGANDFSQLEPLITINFPTGHPVTKEVGTLLGNGNHSAQIAIDCGITEMKQYNFCFDADFNKKYSDLLAFLNEMNKIFVEKRGDQQGDIAKQAYQIMNENIAEGEEHNLTPAQYDALKAQFPEVDKRLVGLWESHHPTHGSRATSNVKSYNKKMLDNIRASYEADEENEGFVVLQPRTLKAWDHTGIAEVFKQTKVHFEKDDPNKKVLLTFYCNGIEQRDSLIKNDYAQKKRILREFKEYSEYYNIEIKVKFLKHTTN